MKDNYPLQRQVGLTLVEVLISMVIFGVLLLVLLQTFVTSNRAYSTTEAITERQQEAATISEILTYEIGLAGYKGTEKDDHLSKAFSSTLEIELGSSSDTIIVHYYEDRTFGAHSLGGLHGVKFYVDSLDGGLYRQDIVCNTGGPCAPVLIGADMASMRVSSIIQRNADVEPTVPMLLPGDLAGINIELSFQEGMIWRFTVGFNNPQIGVVSSL